MLFYCPADVEYSGPTLKQNRVNVSRLLGADLFCGVSRENPKCLSLCQVLIVLSTKKWNKTLYYVEMEVQRCEWKIQVIFTSRDVSTGGASIPPPPLPPPHMIIILSNINEMKKYLTNC